MVFHMERVHLKVQCLTKHSAALVRGGALFLIKIQYHNEQCRAGKDTLSFSVCLS